MNERSHRRNLWLFSAAGVLLLLVALAAIPHRPVSVGATQVYWGIAGHWSFGFSADRVPVWEDEDEPLSSQAAQASESPCHFHQKRTTDLGPIYFGTDRRVPTRPGEVCN